MGISESSTPTFVDHNGVSGREPYPAWSSERQIPLSKEEIEDIFLDLTQKFGFQRDSMRNMVSVFSHVLSPGQEPVCLGSPSPFHGKNTAAGRKTNFTPAHHRASLCTCMYAMRRPGMRGSGAVRRSSSGITPESASAAATCDHRS